MDGQKGIRGRAAWLFLLLKGALIGTGAILPGISGGVLCVTLGVYRPVMALLAHPVEQLRKNWRYFLPIVLGLGAGFVLFSYILAILFEKFEVEATWLFIGLILGTMPSLFKEAGKEGRSLPSWLSLALTFAAALALFLTLNAKGSAHVEPNFFWWAVCGVLWGVGMIVPGLSPSSLFLFLGLYQPMFAGIATFNIGVIAPMGLGLVVTIVALARGMEWMLKKHYAVAMNAVLGFSLASTAAILPFGHAKSIGDIVVYVLCFAVGAFCALMMARMNERMEAAGEK